MRIDRFRGEYAFLSNFADTIIEHEDILYTSVEAAFQAAKTTDMELRRRMARYSPVDAKRAGRKVSLRSDWESVKEDIMYELLKKKFQSDAFGYRTKLLHTGDAELIEGNNHKDTYWGVCNGSGKNRLGHLLMRVRDEIRNEVISDD